MDFKAAAFRDGWAVIRHDPPGHGGIYQTPEEAFARAAEAGPDYEVHFGMNKVGTDELLFAFDPTAQAPWTPWEPDGKRES